MDQQQGTWKLCVRNSFLDYRNEDEDELKLARSASDSSLHSSVNSGSSGWGLLTFATDGELLPSALPRGPLTASSGPPASALAATAATVWPEMAEEPLEKRQQREKDTHTTKVLPEASEEKWQQRIRKRQVAITNMKSLSVYYEYQNIARKRRPQSPDVSNRDFSKRGFELVVAQWRSSRWEIAGVAHLEVMGYSRKPGIGWEG